MKTSLIVTVLALAATAVIPDANAERAHGSGANFQPYNASEATLIDYLPTGVRTYSSNPTYVIASVDHVASTDGQTIYIDGYHYGTQTTSCTVFFYNFAGTVLSSSTVSASSVSGAWGRAVTLPYHDEVPIWGYYSVLCLIPASSSGVIYGTTYYL